MLWRKRIIQHFKDNWTIYLFSIVAIATAYGAWYAFSLVYSQYMTAFEGNFWPSVKVDGPDARGMWGTLGDFFGGTLNPIFASLSIVLLLVTIFIQLMELRATRIEIKSATEAQQESAKHQDRIASAQQTLIKMQQMSLLDIEYAKLQNERQNLRFTNKKDGNPVLYPQVFIDFYQLFKKEYDNDYHSGVYDKNELFLNFNQELIETFQVSLDSYILTFYNFLELLDVYESARHADALRASLSQHEALILSYAARSEYYFLDTNKKGQLIEKYAILKVLQHSNLSNARDGYYSDDAYVTYNS